MFETFMIDLRSPGASDLVWLFEEPSKSKSVHQDKGTRSETQSQRAGPLPSGLTSWGSESKAASCEQKCIGSQRIELVNATATMAKSASQSKRLAIRNNNSQLSVDLWVFCISITSTVTFRGLAERELFDYNWLPVDQNFRTAWVVVLSGTSKLRSTGQQAVNCSQKVPFPRSRWMWLKTIH